MVRHRTLLDLGERGWIDDLWLWIVGVPGVVGLDGLLVVGVVESVQFLQGDVAKFRADLG